MSSEYSIHLGDKPIKGKVYDLGTASGIMVAVDLEVPGNADAGVRLFVGRDRLLEASLLFHKIAQDLAALLPDGERKTKARCGLENCDCEYTIQKLTRLVDDCLATIRQRDAALERRIPIEEAAEHVDPPHRWG